MKLNWIVFLGVLLTRNIYLCNNCDCANTNEVAKENFNDNYLHSFAVMNMDHLYYGVPFYGSGDQVYFHYSDDYPCKCENIPTAEKPSEELIIDCKSKKMKNVKKKTYNLKKNDSYAKIEDNEIELKKLEEQYQIEKKMPVSVLKPYLIKDTNLFAPKKIVKKLTVKYVKSRPKKELKNIKNNAKSDVSNSPYLSEIDKYFGNILDDSKTDFIDALSKAQKTS